MDVPNRAEHPSRKQGDHTSLHDGSYRLQMQDPAVTDTMHSSEGAAQKHGDYIATGKGRPMLSKVISPMGMTSGGSSSPLNETDAASYTKHLKTNPVKSAPAE